MANKNVITEREIYTSILEGNFDEAVLKAFAEKKIAQLDKRNASAKVRAERKRAEGDALRETVFEVISTEPMTRAQITALVNETTGCEYSQAKIGARLNALVKEERICKENGKVAGEDGKNKVAVLYFIGE